MDYVLIALYNGYPVASSQSKEGLEEMLKNYSKGEFVGYIPFPIVDIPLNEIHGTYYFKNNEKDLMEFKIYSVEYKKEKNG